MQKLTLFLLGFLLLLMFGLLALLYQNQIENQNLIEQLNKKQDLLQIKIQKDSLAKALAIQVKQDSIEKARQIFEQKLQEKGLINIKKLDSSILIDLKYASTDNFLNQNVYGLLNKCFLQKDIAEKLVLAQKILKEIQPNYNLLVYDAYRPKSVQYKMWDLVRGTEKEKYVANPVPGSVHNLGAAIDLTIANKNGKTLDMGTPFDYFGKRAEPRYHQQFLASGELTKEQIENRNLLKQVMKKAGFQAILSEWWHFNGRSKTEARMLYKNMDF